MVLLKFVHLISIIIWVGGMFFAYMVLRPSAVDVLQAPERLRLWDCVFSRFFKWVWPMSLSVLISGLAMIHLYGGMASVPRYIHLMLLSGIVMLSIFAYVALVPYPRLRTAVTAQNWPLAGGLLATIRKLVASNLVLGCLTVVIALPGSLIL